MTTYQEYRAGRFALVEIGITKVALAANCINNTGNSRQVRRARERDREGPIRLSNRLETALGYLDEGQGLFMRVKRLRGYMPYKDYARGWAHERREPSEDYSKRYQALFNVLPGAAVHS